MKLVIVSDAGVQEVDVDGTNLILIVDGETVHMQSKGVSMSNVKAGRDVSVNGSVRQSTVITGNGNAVAQGGSVASVNLGRGVNLSGAIIASGVVAGRDVIQSNVTIDGNGNTVTQDASVQSVVVTNGSRVSGVVMGVNHGNIRYNGGSWGDDD